MDGWMDGWIVAAIYLPQLQAALMGKQHSGAWVNLQ